MMMGIILVNNYLFRCSLSCKIEIKVSTQLIPLENGAQIIITFKPNITMDEV